MKLKGKNFWKFLSSISFIISVIILGLGLDKIFNYDNGESFPYEYHNAYVGGDAYNYIINGNYATGFFVLAAMFALMGIGFIVLYYLSKIADGQEGLLTFSHNVESNDPINKTEQKPLNNFIIDEPKQQEDHILHDDAITPQVENEGCVDKGAVHPQKLNSEKMVCPICGTSQNANRKLCFHCGAKFVFDDEP